MNPSDAHHLSPNQRIWRRLLRNKPAIFGLIVICLAVIIALFAYWIAPDNSPDANDQIPELALSEPGFSIQLLGIRKNRTYDQPSWWQVLWKGRPNELRWVPINNYQWVADSIRVEKYAGRDSEADTLYPGRPLRFALTDVAFAIDETNKAPLATADEIVLTDIDGNRHQIGLQTLQQNVKDQHIRQRTFYFGTDRFGRSILSRLILGVRISLLVGLIAVVISLTIGLILGSVAGYFGGRIDDWIMLLINTVWSIPTLILVFAIVLALGRGVGIIFLAVGLTMWVDVARVVRGQVMGLREIQFVEAGRSMGFSDARILFRHLIPNIIGPVMVIAAANFATAILIEAGLSYLGFGIRPPTPSWGTMLNENYGYAISGKPFIALIPAVAIMLMVLAFNLLGNGLRDAMDVRARQ